MTRLELLPIVLALASCSDAPEAPPASAPRPGTAVAHGDHAPHHGGLVLMHGDLHFEVVLDEGGRHRVYLTDAVRVELPAAAASRVAIEIRRPSGAAPENLELAIDEFGESWVANGRPIEEEDSVALVSLTHEGESYEIELPFLPPPPDPNAPDPHSGH
jgi:hypothetical protein